MARHHNDILFVESRGQKTSAPTSSWWVGVPRGTSWTEAHDKAQKRMSPQTTGGVNTHSAGKPATWKAKA